MKRIALVLCLVLSLCLLASCGNKGNEGNGDGAHVHTYEESWSADIQGHWYNMTCDCDEDVAKIAHVDKNNDGACDICEFSNHTHEYSDEWTADCTNHWNAASCGHIVAGANKSAHEDDNDDGKCDVCNYIIEDIHLHVYDDEWSYADGYHWHAAICEHGADQKDKEACTVNAAGFCEICDAKVTEVNEDDIGAIIAAAAAQRSNIMSGMFKFDRGGSLPPLHNTTYYMLGNTGSYIKYTDVAPGSDAQGNRGEYSTAFQRWYELLDNGEVFAVQSEHTLFTYVDAKGNTIVENVTDVSDITHYQSSADQMEGPYYQLSDLELVNHYVLEEVLLALYNMCIDTNRASEVVVTLDKSANKAAFTFGYLVINEVQGSESMGGTGSESSDADVEYTTSYLCKFYNIKVDFIYTDSYEIVEANLSVDAYTDQTLLDENNNTIQPDFTYDHETGKVTWVDGHEADSYSITTTQVVGERVYTSAYPEASIVPQSFELYYNNKPIDGTLEILSGVTAKFVPGKMIPTTADAKFLKAEYVNYSLVNDDTGAALEFGVWFFDGVINVYLNNPGNYTLTYSYFGTERSIKIHAIDPVPTSIETYVFFEASGWGSTWLEVTDTANTDGIGGASTEYTVAVGETFYFLPKIIPFLATQGYTYRVSSTKATVDTATLEDVMVFGESIETFTDALSFTASEAGTYTITITCAEDRTIRGTFTVIVE